MLEDKGCVIGPREHPAQTCHLFHNPQEMITVETKDIYLLLLSLHMPSVNNLESWTTFTILPYWWAIQYL